MFLEFLFPGNILKDGNKTGVLAGGVVSEFQERLISEKLKLARKKSSGQNTQTNQCDQVSSSSPGQAEATGDVKDKDTDTSATDTQDNTEVDETEQDEEKALKAQEEEIEKLEKKRKILENYYKKKMEEKRKSGENEQILKELKEIKEKESKRVKSSPHRSKKKRKKHSSSESDSGESDSESSDSSHRRRRHKSKHSKHKKSSKRHKSSRDRSSHKSSKSKKRSRKETSSSESESSEDDMEERRKLIKAQKESKAQEIPEKVTSVSSAAPPKEPLNQIQSQSEHPLRTSSATPSAEPAPNPGPVSALDAFKNAEIEIRKLLAGSKPEDDVPILKIKPLGELVTTTTEKEPSIENSDVSHDNEQENEKENSDADEEQKGSFMDALKVLDDKPEKSPKKSSHKSSHSHKSSKSSHHEKSHKSSSHKSSSKDKSSSHKSSSKDKSSSHRSSSKDRSSSHKSSSKDKSNSHKSSSKDKSSSHKSSRSSDHKSSDHKSSSSKHKSSSSSSSKHKSSKDKHKERDRESHKGEKEKELKEEEGKSPVPDFSEELAMLPDLMDEDVDDFDNVADGLEEMFAGVEDEDELQRIFEQYEPDSSNFSEDAALRKQRQLEAKERARTEPSSSSSSALAKKRLAHEGAQTSEKRPLHMRKPSHRTPAQVMADRYKKLQMMRQQQMIEKRMTEITDEDPGEGPSTSTSSGLGSSSLGGARSRVAHTVTSGQSPAVLSKAKQQLAAREKAKEVMKQTPAITNVKGTQRKAHTSSSTVVRKPFVTPDPKSKVPTTVRQKYLDTIITECLKITGGEELEAYTRAEREEANCCRKASSRMLYLNLVVSTIKKLRAEATAAAASAQHRKSAPNLSEKRSMLTTHLQVG